MGWSSLKIKKADLGSRFNCENGRFICRQGATDRPLQKQTNVLQ